MTEDEILQQLIHNAMFAADHAAISAKCDQMLTPHGVTAAAMEAAFRMAIGNRMISIRPQSEWAKWMACEPPYDPDAPFLPAKDA